MDILITCEEINDLAKEMLPTVRDAALDGVRASKVVSRAEGQLAEPVTQAISIAVKTGLAGVVVEKLTKFVWDSIASWIKRKNKPVQVENDGRKVTITVEMAHVETPPIELKVLFGDR